METSFEQFFVEEISGEQLEALLAQGWRRFGETLFRYNLDHNEKGEELEVIPLRINLEKFYLRKSHRKLLRRNAGVRAQIAEMHIDDQKRTMFSQHKQRFKYNLPTSLFNFVSYDPQIPCPTYECQLYTPEKELYAVSFIDITPSALSSIYAMFKPNYAHLSPGTHTLLAEIDYAKSQGKAFVYTGYAHRKSSHYDYKKTYPGTEYYDWEKEKWFDLPETDF